MFLRWCGGCGIQKTGLMNMLEALNTLVSIIHPSVVTWGGGTPCNHNFDVENRNIEHCALRFQYGLSCLFLALADP